MKDVENILLYIWLAQSFPYGSVKPKQIVLSFNGNLNNFYNNLDENVKKFDLTEKRIKRLKSKTPSDYLKTLELCDKLKIKIVCFYDENYPYKLKSIDSSPIVLYYVGDLSVAEKPSVAIVGTRKASLYGLTTANKLAKKLSAHNLTVVSGCADGIDSSAHTGVIEVEGTTISVLGTSIERPYPLGSNSLKRKIVRLGGLIISEYIPKSEVFPWLFPIRNRLIVGLSDCVIIVESPKKSGAVITANIACDYGKEVFCVPPSNIFNSNNDGIKHCLKNGANLLLDVSDILNFYKFSDYVVAPKQMQQSLFDNSAKPKQKKKIEVPAKLKPLFNLISPNFDLDSAARTLKIPINQVLEMLTELEMIGVIKKFGLCYKKF